MAPKDLNKTTLGGGTAAAGPHYAVRHGNRTIPLPLGETLVGRGTDCQIVLDSPLVSRRHAKIIVTPVGVMVEDLGSINGVKIDSRPLKGRIEVDVGTRVSVADEMLEVVRLGEDRPATAPEVKKAVTVQVRVEPESDEVSVTARRKDAFSLLARVVDKALALGRGDEAERLMTSMLEGALSEAEAGLKLPSGLAEDAARYAIRIALATKKPSWVDYAIRLFHTLGRPFPSTSWRRPTPSSASSPSTARSCASTPRISIRRPPAPRIASPSGASSPWPTPPRAHADPAPRSMA